MNQYNKNAGIDVVIPYYNHHSVIGRALASIAQQTIARDVNVVIVNDASSPEDMLQLRDIVRGFRDTNLLAAIKIVDVPENMGPGHARAVGQQSCNHEFITFMDADDTWANAYALQFLHDAFVQHRQLDAVFGVFLEETENPEVKFVAHGQDATWMFGKMYRRAFLDRYEILMSDSRSNEDMAFNQLVLACTDNVGFLDQPVYFWMANKESITRKADNDYQFRGLLGYIDGHTWAESERRKRNLHDKEKGLIAAVDALIMCYFYYMEVLQNRPVDQQEECYAEVKRFYDTAFGDRQVPMDIANQRYVGMSAAHSQPGGLLTRVVPKMSLSAFVEKLGE